MTRKGDAYYSAQAGSPGEKEDEGEGIERRRTRKGEAFAGLLFETGWNGIFKSLTSEFENAPQLAVGWVIHFRGTCRFLLKGEASAGGICSGGLINSYIMAF
jgi:hypothetical protein